MRMKLRRVSIPDRYFNAEQLVIGTREEARHIGNPEVAKSIAKSRLMQNPDYYKNLVRLQGQMKHNFLYRHTIQAMTPNWPWTMKIY